MSKPKVDTAYSVGAWANKDKAPPAGDDPAKAFDKGGVKKGFLDDTKAKGKGGLYAEDEAAKRSDAAVKADPVFDAMMAEVDAEFSKATKSAAKDPGEDDDDGTLDQLRTFADSLKFGEMYGSFGKQDREPVVAEKLEVEREAAAPAKKEKKGVLKDFGEGFIQKADAKAADRAKAAKAAKAALDAAAAPLKDMLDGGEGGGQQKKKPAAGKAALAYETTALAPAADGRKRVQIVAKLDGVSTMRDLDVDVGADVLRLARVADKKKVKIALPFSADPASASAKFSKKKAALTVVLTAAH